MGAKGSLNIFFKEIAYDVIQREITENLIKKRIKGKKINLKEREKHIKLLFLNVTCISFHINYNTCSYHIM